MFNLREKYWLKSREARTQFLVHTTSMRVKNGRFTYIRLDTGKEVCQRAFCCLLRVNKNALTRVRKQSKRNANASTTRPEKTISKKVNIFVFAYVNTCRNCTDSSDFPLEKHYADFVPENIRSRKFLPGVGKYTSNIVSEAELGRYAFCS